MWTGEDLNLRPFFFKEVLYQKIHHLLSELPVRMRERKRIRTSGLQIPETPHGIV